MLLSSSILGLTVSAFGIDKCAQEANKTGACQNTVRAGYAFTVISGDYGQFPAPPVSLTFVSIDLKLEATYESLIKSLPRTCADKPCLNNGICHDVQPEGLYCFHFYKFSFSCLVTLVFSRGAYAVLVLDQCLKIRKSVVRVWPM